VTPQQALREARRRWGKNGHVTKRKAEGPTCCTVGKIVLGLMFGVEGQGPTFEAAFRDVDTKEIRRAKWSEAEGQPCPDCSRTMTKEARDRLLSRGERVRVRTLELKLKRLPRGEERTAVAVAHHALRHPHMQTVVERAGEFVAVCRTCVNKSGEERR
jgi:hypothetical protein